MRPAAPAWLPIPRALPIRGARELRGGVRKRNPTWGQWVQGRGREDPQASVSLVGLKEQLP